MLPPTVNGPHAQSNTARVQRAPEHWLLVVSRVKTLGGAWARF